MSNVVAFGYGKRITTRGSGPASFGYGGYIFVPLRISRDSSIRNLISQMRVRELVAASAEQTQAADTTKTPVLGVSIEAGSSGITSTKPLSGLKIADVPAGSSSENTTDGDSAKESPVGTTEIPPLEGTTVDPAEPRE